MQIKRKDLKSALTGKGFDETAGSNHDKFVYRHKGKKTRVFTVVSRGSAYRTLQDGIIKKIRTQLYLDNASQLKDLAECPLTKRKYANILKRKNVI